jgi:photosystem II stability/assembly factor-like uncharacterized protein
VVGKIIKALLLCIIVFAAATDAGHLIAVQTGYYETAPVDYEFIGSVGGWDLFVGPYGAPLPKNSRLLMESTSGYRFYRIERASGADLSEYGETVFADGDEILLAREAGILYQKTVWEIPYPWREFRPVRVSGTAVPPKKFAAAEPDPRIAYLLTLIEEDDVEDDLIELTSFPTRYSLSEYRDDAALWLRDRLEGMGLQAYLDYYISNLDFYSCYFFPGTDDGWLVGNNGRAVFTDDGGATWALHDLSTDEELVDVYFADSQHGWVVGTGGTVLRTVDGGAEWETVAPPVLKALTGVHFVSPTEGWVCGTDGVILHSTDGGVTWDEQDSNFDLSFFEIEFVNDLVGYAVGRQGEVRATTDGGETWVRKVTPYSDPSGPYDTVALVNLDFISENEGWVVGNKFEVILYTADGGDTWDVQRYETNGGYIGDLHFWDETAGLTVGAAFEVAKVLQTDDGGTTWTEMFIDADYELTGLSFADDEHGWAVGYGANIMYTADGGDTWTNLRDTLPGKIGWENVVAEIPGTDDPSAEYLLTAHFDSISDDPYNLAPGADDNGSGVCALLAAARALSATTFDRTIKFVFFSGEEQGLLGSRDYARRAREGGDDIRAVLNLDMVGYAGDGPLDEYLYYNDDSDFIDYDVGLARRLYVPEIGYDSENNAFAIFSDHASFWQEGYTAGFFTEDDSNGSYPYYHTTDDVIEYLSIPLVTGAARIAAATAAAWAGLSGGVPTLDVSDIRVYPNPYRPTVADGITFDRVPSGTEITVYNLAGERTAGGTADSGGSWEWNVRAADGSRVASGVYIFVARDPEGKTVTGRVAVVK